MVSSKLEDICKPLAKAGAILRPIGFLDPKDSPAGVYAGLPIQSCQSGPLFSDFKTQLCGLSEQWHAHFPTVRSQDLSVVLGIYVPDHPNLVGFISFPGENVFDRSVLQSVSKDAVVLELSIADLPGQDSKLAWLGDSPSLDVAFVGSSEGAYRIFAEAHCQGQSFDIYGIFRSAPRSGSTLADEDAPNGDYLKKLTSPWLGQQNLGGFYQSGFVFLAKSLSTELNGVTVVDHEEVLSNSIAFEYPDSSIETMAEPWVASASLALATYTADPGPAKAEEAARWLLAVDDVLANFHFPELWELHAKHFPVVLMSDENPIERSEFCDSCGEAFEFDADQFCGACGEARGVN